MSKSDVIKEKALHLTHGQINLKYTEGKGYPLLLLHAVGNSSESFASLISQMEVPVIAPDLFGFGKSSLNDRHRIKAHALDMVELINALNIDTFWVAGNSFGGDIALEIALQIPHKVNGVVSLNGGGLTLDTPALFKLMLKPPLSSILFSKFLGSHIWNAYVSNLYYSQELKKSKSVRNKLNFLKQPGRMTALLNNLKHLEIDRTALHTRILNIGVPSIVIYGENDPEFSVEYGQILAETIGAKFVKIPQAGHFVHEDQPEIVASRIDAWIKSMI